MSATREPAILPGALGRAERTLASLETQASTARFLLACTAVALALVFLSTASQGLWEDGYFVKRFAHNFLRHGSFSWNVEDGPVYGMTSQTLQLVGTLVYAVMPEHVVIGLKAVLYASLFATLLVCHRVLRASGSPDVAVVPCAIVLSTSLVVQVTLMGLETTLGLLAVALALFAIFDDAQRKGWATRVTLATLLVYLTRPDAVLVPGVLLAIDWLLALVAREREPERFRVLTRTGFSIAAGLALCWLAFWAYYGTPVPLPFYIKTQGLSVQTDAHLRIFELEKNKNALQAAFFALPLVLVALHGKSGRVVRLLAAGAVFVAYHYFATIETMGYFSRFYLPALVPFALAAGLAYPEYLSRARWPLRALAYAAWLAAYFWLKRLDLRMGIPHMLPRELDFPVLVAMGALLLAPRALPAVASGVAGLSLLVGTALTYPIARLELRDDESILLAQIRRRLAFRGLEQLRRTLDPAVVYHTDMGAPGVLLPEARVVDLDGLLNEDITLRGASFDELCEADDPEAIFVPNHTYPELREEVLTSACIEGYVAVTPMNGSPLFVRRDLAGVYRANGARAR